MNCVTNNTITNNELLFQNINTFVKNIVDKSTDDNICFDIVTKLVNGTFEIQNSSDIDFIFKDYYELVKFTRIILNIISNYNSFKILSVKKFSSGEQWTFYCENYIFIFDLMLEMRFHNIRLMDSRVYFELKDAGLDAAAIARFIKYKTAFKQSWPRVPPESYGFNVKKINLWVKAIYIFNKLSEIFATLWHTKSGMLVVILGPDGSGKSAVINQITTSLCGQRPVIPIFSYHWRVQLLANNKTLEIVTEPHGQPERSFLMSVLKLGYLWLTFNLGYWLKLFRLLHRGCIVMFDRYYHDLLIDTQRYRYKGPLWLARLVGTCVPQPDLVILLDAPTEVLQSRKQEVPFAETMRQREAYLNLVQQFPSRLIVDASQPLDMVCEEISKVILNTLAQRNASYIHQLITR